MQKPKRKNCQVSLNMVNFYLYWKRIDAKYRDTGGSMSVFSDLLSEYITMKDVGVYPLSQFCGLDRSFMYKIINGKRNPSGEDVVRKMAQFMQLTPQEK